MGGSTYTPTIQELVKMMGKDPNVRINTDKLVTLGATIQVDIFMLTNNPKLMCSACPCYFSVFLVFLMLY